MSEDGALVNKLGKHLRREPSLVDRGLLRWVLSCQDDAEFARRFRLANKRWQRPLDVSFDADEQLFIVKSDGTETFVARRNQLNKYTGGSNARAQDLANEYLLDRVRFSPGDVVIDVGANIGEVSRLLTARHGVTPIAIEPDRREFAALARNLCGFNAETHNALLWSEEAELPFFDANDSGDSSVFNSGGGLRSEVRQATTLDLILEDSVHAKGPIRLIKLEAEGAEPEVLLGGRKTLLRTHYVTADLGPERGVEQESTLAPVHEILTSHGFRIVDLRTRRLVVLYRRQVGSQLDLTDFR